MSTLADRIKEAVPMEAVLVQYGFQPKRGSFLCCPFHPEDHTPSLKVYPGGRGWHCFGCGAGGSVIDFVQQLFGITFRQAVVRLNSDFGLGLMQEQPDRRATAKRLAALQEQQRRETNYQAAQLALCHYHSWLWESLKLYAPKHPEDEPDPRFVEALQRLDYIEYILEQHP